MTEQPGNAVATPAETARASVQEQKIYVASQRQLMWWRFRKHKLALISTVVLIAFYLVALFCEFLAPYDPLEHRTIAGRVSPPSICSRWCSRKRSAFGMQRASAYGLSSMATTACGTR